MVLWGKNKEMKTEISDQYPTTPASLFLWVPWLCFPAMLWSVQEQDLSWVQFTFLITRMTIMLFFKVMNIINALYDFTKEGSVFHQKWSTQVYTIITLIVKNWNWMCAASFKKNGTHDLAFVFFPMWMRAFSLATKVFTHVMIHIHLWLVIW